MENLIIMAIVIIAIIIMLALVSTINNDIKASNKKRKLMSTVFIPSEASTDNTIIVKQKVDSYLSDLTKNNGIKDDGPKEIIKDLVISMIVGICMTGCLAFILKQPLVLFVGPIFGLLLPVYSRISGKRTYHQNFVDSFYNVIDYIILYTSGGINIMKAIEETEKLISDKDVIKESLKRVIATKNMSGVSNESYLDSLKLLNKGVDAPEINDFLRTISLQMERGTPLVETLHNQLHFIKQKEILKEKEKISKVESQISILKTPLCSLPLLGLLIIPPMIEVFKMF